MLSYSIPMVPNSAMWWITNSSDRYLVSYMVSVAANGVLSVSYKIPSMLSIAISVFMGAWQISVVEDFESESGKKFFNLIYMKFLEASILMTSLLIILSESFARIMYANDFFCAWRYSALLILGFNLHAVAGFLGTAFTSAKNTKPLFYSTLTAAVVNIVLNILLIKIMGTMGAVFATVISYFITYVIRRVMVKDYIMISINTKKIILEYFIIGVQLSLLLLVQGVFRYVCCIMLFFVICILNYSFIKSFLEPLKRIVR